MKRARSQRFSLPLRQNRHSPHAHPSQGTPTRSPGASLSTPGPIASTMPTIWWPRTSGSFGSEKLPVQHVEIRPADAAGLYADTHLSGRGLRNRELLENEL